MTELVLLDGAPGPRGERLGICQREALKRRVNAFKALCESRKLTIEALSDRGRELVTTLNLLGQEWVIEARAVTALAQVPTAIYMAITHPPAEIRPTLLAKRANDSVAIAVAKTADCPALLMANFDGPEIAHHVISRASSPGTLAYVGMTEMGDLGVKAFVNEAGLSGVFHMGPALQHAPDSAMQPSLMLRQIGERATSCAQALTECEALLKHVGAATPCSRGVCYLFADSGGEIMLLESAATTLQHSRLGCGQLISVNRFQLGRTPGTSVEVLRQRHLRELLARHQPSVRALLNGARIDHRCGSEKGVSDIDTRASFVAALGDNGRPHVALVTMGTPLFNSPFPLIPGIGAPREAVDDTAYVAATRGEADCGAATRQQIAYEDHLLAQLPGVTSATAQAFVTEMWEKSRAK